MKDLTTFTMHSDCLKWEIYSIPMQVSKRTCDSFTEESETGTFEIYELRSPLKSIHVLKNVS